jgi:nucleotide-binding universal stress UspA family protein
MNRIAVGVDGTPASLAALRWGVAEARRRRSDLHLVYALGWSPFRGHRPWAELNLLRAADETLHEILANLRRRAPDLHLSAEVEPGAPAEALRRAGAGCGLLVVGAPGHHRRIGEVAGSVATRTPGAVVVVPEQWRAEAGAGLPVIAAPTGAGATDPVLAWAIAAAARCHTGLVVLRAGAGAAAHRRELDRAIARRRAAHPEVEVRMWLPPDDPRAALPAAAEHARLLVVGSAGAGEAGAADGPAGHYLLRHAGCPVAVINAVASAPQPAPGRPGPAGTRRTRPARAG